MLVEWIAFFQLYPPESERADWRSTWHTGHLLAAQTTSEFQLNADTWEALTPKYWKEPQVAVSSLTKAQQLQRTILNHFAK